MKKTVVVTIEKEIEVEIDESKFTEEFMSTFRDSFYPFHDLNDHIEHLAQLAAQGMANAYNDAEFIDGYGYVKPMGIKFDILSEYADCEME